MTKCRIGKKAHTLRGAAALIIAAFFTLAAMAFTACKQPTEPTATSKYKVTFNVDGGGGTLTAKIGETEIKSGNEVEANKTVTFTATPDTGYKVKGWTLDGKPVNGADNSYQLKIEKAVTVKMSFEKLPPGKASYTVKHYQEKIEGGYPAEPAESENQNGTVGANAAYTAKNYTGFTYKSALTKVNNTVQTEGTINADSSTVVELYYERNTVNVTFKLAGGNVSGNTADIIKTGKYGTALTAPAPEREGYAFKGWSPAPLSPLAFPAINTEYTAQWKINEYPVTFSAEDTGGTLTAKADGVAETETSPITVEHGKTVTFTATPNTDYMVDTWTVTPSAALQEGGTEGSTTAKVKITEATTVKVSFTKYKKAAYGTNGDDLKNYLTTASPASDGIYYIEVTGLTAADLEGTVSRPSPLGKILKDNPAKKVSLKLPKAVEGLTDMRYCFNRCENLVSVAVIPESVTNMNDCFFGCTSLTQVSALPQSVKYIIRCFQGCTSLEKAPAIPEGVTNISECFVGCTSLTEAPAIPESVENMEGCFYGCTNLENAPAIPKSVTYMSYCFSRCTNLTEAPTIPESVENMEGCFYGCTNLENAPLIPESVKDISNCFSGCTKLTQGPAIPKNTEFMVMCFQNCTNLTSVTLKCNYGDGGKFGNAFKDCTTLGEKSIKVPQAYYDAYTTAEALNSMAVPGATEAEKKAKFEGV